LAADTDLDIIVHAGVDSRPLDAAALNAIFTGVEKKWKNGTPIKVFNLTAQSLERNEFDRVVLRKTPEQVAQFWVDRLVRGEGQPPTQVPKAELVVKVVASMPGAIGYTPPDKADPSKTKIVARIRAGKVVTP
jgi:ABC-type phosphate transport system substrate-binding protein